MGRLDGKVAVVTGGARGIGWEIARLFAQEGADVALCDVSQEALAEPCREIESLGRRSLGIACDVTQASSVEEFLNKVIDKLGRVDILVNNAGITRDGLLIRMKDEDWQAVLRVNLDGTFYCTRAVARMMLKQRSGVIVNMASVIGLMGNAGQANYAASKAGVIALTKSAAKELASRGIRVNAIAPGFIKTAMTAKLADETQQAILKEIPLGEFGQPSDVAQAALFLASDGARYITGHVIQVDGGLVM